MKYKILLVILGLFVLVAGTAAIIDNPETIKFEAKNGAVTFQHKAHVDRELTCKTCHHTVASDNDTPEKTCHDCHNAESKPDAKTAFHNSCRNCHKDHKKEKADSVAPTSCKKCHVKE